MTSMTKAIQLQGEERLQSRAAALLVQEACKYASRILIQHGTKTVNGKSMMGVLSIGQPSQGTMTLSVEGQDAPEAMEAVFPLLKALFQEA